MRTLCELHTEGAIRFVGLSEVTAAEIRRAHAVFPVSALQMEWSLQTRDIEGSVLPAARELGIGIVAYSPLGRGLLSGTFSDGRGGVVAPGKEDWRASNPRFSPDMLAVNASASEKVGAVLAGAGLSASRAQAALAWVLAQGTDVVVIPGAKTYGRMRENLRAATLVLPQSVVQALAAAVPEAAGARYASMESTHNARVEAGLPAL